MFDKIQHIGYYTANLDAAVAWFNQGFGSENAGGGVVASSVQVPGGGSNAFLRFGQVEVELIQPADTSNLPQDGLVMHHVAYVVSDILQAIEDCKARGFKFLADAPRTNQLGQQLLYFDPTTTNNVLLHLTQLPEPADAVTTGVGGGVQVAKIVHAGYRVPNLDEAIAWYAEKFDGEHIGGGPSRTGSRNAFVNFGQVQVELIEPGDPTVILAGTHTMDHVGYVVGDIPSCMGQCQANGLRFVADSPNTNSIGQQVLYFDTETSQGSRMHLTRLPD
jgi:catechol 2,3-dioxygenase-like lactoylglutathione lyase family enzyme